MNEIELSKMENDALKEIANVGAGHAAGGLSIIVNRKVNLMVSEIKVCKIKDNDNNPQYLNQKSIVIFSPVIDELGGNLILTFSWESYAIILNMIKGDIKANIEEIESQINDIKNIGQAVFYSYSTALNQFLNLNIHFKEPSFIVGHENQLMKELYKANNINTDFALIIKTGFNIENSEARGEFEMSFAPNEINNILEKVKENFRL
jgi:chemotaxis protein CheC